MGFIVNPYAFGVGTPAPWTPASLGSALKAWYDADQQSEADGAEVATFTDRSGNGFHATKNGTGPAIRHAYVNGKKAVEAGGTVGVCRMDISSSLLNGATAATMMMVVKVYADPTTSPDDEAVFQLCTSAASDTNHFYTDGKIYENFASSTRRDVNPTPSMASWRIYGAHSASNDWKMWLDGTAIITSATNTVGTGSAGRRLFKRAVGAGNFRGHLAELVICNTKLSDSDREKLEGYYAHKYGLTANLPGGHPYISSPP